MKLALQLLTVDSFFFKSGNWYLYYSITSTTEMGI